MTFESEIAGRKYNKSVARVHITAYQSDLEPFQTEQEDQVL